MDSAQRHAVLSACEVLHTLDARALAQLARAAQVLRVGDGFTLLHKNQRAPGLYVVARGSVKLYLSAPSGKEFCLGVLGRGLVVDGTGPLARSTAPLQAITTEASCLLLIPQQALEQTMTALQRAHALNQHLLERQLLLIETLEDVALHALDKRVARLLLRLYLQSVRNAAARLHRLDQSLLASMANGSRPKVNEHLQVLRRLGAIDIEGGAVVVRRPELLAAMREQTPVSASVT